MRATTVDGVGWHDAIAARFRDGYRRSAGFRERLALWRGLIDEVVAPGDVVLDVGCGPGQFAAFAADRGAAVIGIDASAQMIALAREHERPGRSLRFETADIAALDARPAASVDVILCSSVLEYVDRLDLQLARLARLLRPGGRLVVSLPNRQSLYRRAERVAFALSGRPRYFAHVVTRVSAAELNRALTVAGLRRERLVFVARPPRIGALTALLPDRLSRTLIVAVARREGGR